MTTETHAVLDVSATHSNDEETSSGSICKPGISAATNAAAKASSPSGPQLAGTLWFAGWLFTIGFTELVWWKAVLGLLVWPYFLGTHVRI